MRARVIDGLRVVALPGVYTPSSDTALLAHILGEQQRLRPDGTVLEVCAGTGTLALTAARSASAVTAVDLCPRAVANLRLNARLNRLRVDAHCGDLFLPVAGRRFDLILANPPYMPTPPGAVSGRGSQAWDAGWDGRTVLDRIAREAGAHLQPGGLVLIVQSVFADEARTAVLLRASGLEVSVLARHRQPLGPISRRRLEHLEHIGALDPGDPADELVVLAARRP